MKSPPKPSVFIDKSREYLAEFQLRLGVICFDLETAKSPDLVNNFVYLATQSYFDGTPLYRVIQGHVVQGGDPGGTGEGGVSYHLPDTIITVPHSLGTLSMANMGPNTNGSQFFITLRDMPWLDKIYSVIGQARRGIDRRPIGCRVCISGTEADPA